MKKVVVLMGSANDRDAMKPAVDMLTRFGVDHSVWVMSAHRTPAAVSELVGSARADGFGVVIAAAGLAAHLAGACAAHTTLPVIGVPIASGALNGVDSLYSTVQMPPGVPVATVGIGNAANAGLLAVQILSVGDDALAKRLEEYRAQWKPEKLS